MVGPEELGGPRAGEVFIVGEGTKVWQNTQVREGAIVGSNCVIGSGVYVGPGVRIGDNCKIQNSALIYDPATLGNGVFVGPGAVFTNDRFPRAVNPDGTLKGKNDWDSVGVIVEDGVSVGARAVCVAPLKIGKWAMVAAGAVVTSDVAPFSLVSGIPARHVGWVGRSGYPLKKVGDLWVCPRTAEEYVEISGALIWQE